MSNPFLQDAESTHEYKGVYFVVDCYYPTWQCSDERHIVRERALTKELAIEYAHKSWDNYLLKQPKK